MYQNTQQRQRQKQSERRVTHANSEGTRIKTNATEKTSWCVTTASCPVLILRLGHECSQGEHEGTRRNTHLCPLAGVEVVVIATASQVDATQLACSCNWRTPRERETQREKGRTIRLKCFVKRLGRVHTDCCVLLAAN